MFVLKFKPITIIILRTTLFKYQTYPIYLYKRITFWYYMNNMNVVSSLHVRIT